VSARHEGDFAPLPHDGEIRLPDPPDESASDENPGGSSGSRLEDIELLIDDVLTYVDAELLFQKTRASYVADGIKKTVAFVLVAVFLALFAIIGLVVGLIMALTPLVTAWGATAIVVGGMFLIAFLLVLKAGKTWKRTMASIKPAAETDEDG